MAIDARNLTGARASSAVRCIAKAEHEALGTPGEDNTPEFLQRAFKRGVNVGRAWAASKAIELGLEGHTVTQTEWPIPWGLGWEGHADLIDPDAKTVYEAYHAAGGVFREEKALQAAFYADALGEDWKAELVVIDTTDVSDEEGFAVQGYEINVDGLRDRVRDIKQRVVTAVEAGEVNMTDRVGESPHHSECRSCPFRQACWDGWQPPAPHEVAGMEDKFVALKVTDSDRHHAKAALARIEERRAELIEQITEVVPESGLVRSGDVTVKRTTVKAGVTFSLTDALKAGHSLPAELEAFTKPRKGYDKWEVIAP